MAASPRAQAIRMQILNTDNIKHIKKHFIFLELAQKAHTVFRGRFFVELMELYLITKINK